MIPTAGGAVILTGNGSAGVSTYDLGSPALASIILNSSANPYTISPNNSNVDIVTLVSGGAITDNNSGLPPDNVATGIAISGALFAVNGVATLSFSRPISGTGGLTLEPASGGAISLLVANSYTGPTVIDGGGVVRLFANGAVPIGSALTVSGTAIFAQSSTADRWREAASSRWAAL